jgi:BRCA1 C Terminus (BRCT) domain
MSTAEKDAESGVVMKVKHGKKRKNRNLQDRLEMNPAGNFVSELFALPSTVNGLEGTAGNTKKPMPDGAADDDDESGYKMTRRNKRRPRKRRRGTSDTNATQTTASTSLVRDGNSAAVIDANRSPLPLQGVIVSVSTLSEERDRSKAQSADNSILSRDRPTSYQDVCARCRALGAAVSEMVSKRIYAVVCSNDAIKQATQRVRKAIKRGKPIVSLEWIEACEDLGQLANIEPFRLDLDAMEAIKRRKDTQNQQAAEMTPSFEQGKERKLDLGCCCVCHEQGTTADCPWCQHCV